ncbi:MAG: glycosyltransferase family 4 protein [Candidatus Omnitrophica bacterium]|jgi:glycosyltransferase involved in cell wall biosynthesis|nr:glycosyltransferase family 4 protein [Candidatus Omnitrophota bacterium]
MNILLLSNHLNVGGISSYILTLAKGLQNKGHKVYVASGAGELLVRLKDEGIIHIPVPLKTKAEISPNVLISFFKLLPEMKKKNIDIIHANTRVTQVLSCFLSRYSGAPFISTCHGFFKKRLFRKILSCWGERVIAISEQVKEHLVNDFGVQKNRIRLVHNGIDLTKFSPQLSAFSFQQKKDFALSDGPVIGIVARLSDVKGHIYLIQAMKMVLEKIPSAQLVIVGEGKIKDSLVKLSRELCIEKSMKFIPNVMDTRGILSVIDLFVLPSLKEGLGLSLMEAMSMGKAVVGSNIGGIKSLIQHRVNGLLVEPANPEQLALAIIELLQDAAKRELFGQRALEFIAGNFSQSDMISKTEEVYQECVKR